MRAQVLNGDSAVAMVLRLPVGDGLATGRSLTKMPTLNVQLVSELQATILVARFCVVQHLQPHCGKNGHPDVNIWSPTG